MNRVLSWHKKFTEGLYYCCYKLNIVFLPLYLASFSVYAQSNPEARENFGKLLINLSKSVPNLIAFLSGLTVVTGIAFIIMALFKLKHLADFRNMMSGQQEIGKAGGLMFMGVVFIWMPYILNVITYTLFRQGVAGLQSKYPVIDSSGGLQTAFFIIMQGIGIISFVRGWYILAAAAKGGQHQQGAFGKAVTHILAGAFLFNLRAFMGVIEQTLGINFIKALS